MQSVNGAQFLNITPLFLSYNYNRLVASSFPATVTAIVSLKSIFTSL